MSLSKFKMRLELEEIRAFHEHTLRILHERKRQTSVFLKFLLISKIFFNVARRYEIYQFALSYNDGLDLSLNVVSGSNSYYTFRLSPTRLEKLIKFLNPKIIAVDFFVMPDETIGQCDRLLEQLRGKISVDACCSITDCLLSFMQKFTVRIHQLKSSAESLTTMKSIILELNLDSCDFLGIYAEDISLGGFRLLHLVKAKKLRLCTILPPLDDEILTNVEITGRNRSVAHLLIDFYGCTYASIDLILNWISTRFLKLQRLDLEFWFLISNEEFESGEVVKQILRYYEKLQEIQDIFSHLARFNLLLRLERDHSLVKLDDSWIKNLGKYEKFKNAQASISRHTYGTIHKWFMESKTNNSYGNLEVSIWQYTDDE